MKQYIFIIKHSFQNHPILFIFFETFFRYHLGINELQMYLDFLTLKDINNIIIINYY